MLLRLLEVVVWVLVMLFFATQIVIPALKETAFFPMFRPERVLKSDLINLQQSAQELLLQAEKQRMESVLREVSRGIENSSPSHPKGYHPLVEEATSIADPNIIPNSKVTEKN